jgi:hypothetical protein
MTTWTLVVRGTIVGVSDTRYPTQASASPVADTAGLLRTGTIVSAEALASTLGGAAVSVCGAARIPFRST